MVHNLRDDYIEDKYSLDIEEWPPDLPKTVVNVALIHYKGSRTEQELIEISRRHKEGTPAIDELVNDSKVTKDISKIFQAGLSNSSDNSEVKPPKTILIEGAPGIGKTVLAKKIACCWAKKELLTDVKVLFLLFLRDPELHNITTPVKLIQYMSGNCFNDEEAENCVQQIRRLQVAIVMDGFDECPIELRKNSFIANLLKGRIFNNSIVVLTSRPTATINLHGKVDQRVEILGFAQEERDKYIAKSLDSPDQRKQLQDYLKSRPIINGLVYVPLHLAILLHLFKIESKLPETLTEMNESFILHTIYRSLAKNELTRDGPDTVISNIKDLSATFLDIVKGLSKLAFIGLQKSKLVFSYSEVMASCPEIANNVPGAFNGFGLLQVVPHFPKKRPGIAMSFNFLHFTMQEFLAAFYISDITINPCEQQLSLMETTFWDGLYTFMWMMYVGINGINSQAFMQFLYKAEPEANIRNLKLSKIITSDKIKCLHLFQCFMEAKSEQFPKEISKIFYNNEINFCGLQLLPQHISSITLYISKCAIQLRTLNLRDCHIGDVGMSILLQYFTANPDAASNIKHLDLFGNNSVLLWNVYCAIFGLENLEKLDWSSLGGVNIEEIVNVMDNNIIVQSLNLSDNCFKYDDALKIADILNNNTTLQELDISNNNITTRGAIAISESLCNKIKLQCLKMSWNNYILNTNQSTIIFSHSNIKNGDARILSNVLCSNRTVTELNLSRNKISENGAKDISNCIEINKSLKEINLSRNKISDIGLKKIAIALQKNQTLQKLNISRNNISDDGAIAISDCLKNNSTLMHLNISQNKISNDGIINIGEGLQTNATLQLLDISYNKICNDGIVIFCDHLKRKSGLQELTISLNNGIYLVLNFMAQSYNMCKMNLGNTGAVLISTLLYINANLQKLDISNTNISDDGVLAISEGIKNYVALQELNLSGNEITDNGVVAISKILKDTIMLQKLDLSANEITDEGIEVILKSSQLKSPLHTLNLTYNIVSKSMLLAHDIYEKVKNISSFKISYNEIVNRFHTVNVVFVDFKEFHQLTISCKIKYDIQNKSTSYKVKVSCYCAKNNDSIEELNVSYFNIYNQEAKIVSKVLQTNMILQRLNISHNNISDDGVVAISEGLKKNISIQELDVSANEITDEGIVLILKSIDFKKSPLCFLNLTYNIVSKSMLLAHDIYEKVKNISSLKISYNEMVKEFQSVKFFTVLVDFEKLNHLKLNCIMKLDMRNKSTSYKVKVFCYCAKNNNLVKELNLSSFDIANEEAKIISKALQTNMTLWRLDISHNNISDEGAISISEGLKNNNSLQELNMSHNKVTNNAIISFAKALQINTTLQILNLSHNKFLDDGLLQFSSLLKKNNTLHKLIISWNGSDLNLNFTIKLCNISRNQLGNGGIIFTLALLLHNTFTEELIISHNNVSDDGAVAISECIKNNNTLQKLDMSYNSISNNGIIIVCEALKTNKTLQKINISHNNISDEGVIAISDCLKNNNSLQELNMSYTEVSNNGIINVWKALKRNTTLQKLNISHSNRFDDEVVTVTVSESFKENKTLQELIMSYNEVSINGIINVCEALKMVETLQKINISHNKITDEGAVVISEYLREKISLKELDISANLMTCLGIIKIAEAIQTNMKLRSLDITHNLLCKCRELVITLENCLKRNSTLEVLGISWDDNLITYFYIIEMNNKCFIDNIQPRPKKINKTVHYVHKYDADHQLQFPWYLQLNYTEAVLLIALAYGNVNIQVIEIVKCEISDGGAQILCDFLKENRLLQKLQVSKSIISNKTMKQLIEVIQTNNTLLTFDVSHNDISDDGELAISEIFKHNKALKVLNIAGNDINLQGAKVIADCIRKNTEITNITDSVQPCTTLKRLDISHNSISYDGAIAVGKYLGLNKTLEELNLSDNKICNYAIGIIIEAIESNTTLLELNISDNSISYDGAVAISKYVKANKTLKTLDLSLNRISSNGAVSIAEAITSNATLQKLDISHNIMSKDAIVLFSSYLKYNSALEKLIISGSDRSTTYIYTSTTKCCVDGSGLSNKSYVNTNNSYLWFDDSEAILLTSFVNNINKVKSLEILKSRISDDAAIIIGNFLKTDHILQEFKFSGNRISDKSVQFIMKAIQTNTCSNLQFLDISSNSIHDDDIAEAIRTLEYSVTFEAVDISKYYIGDGIKVIANFLSQENPSLQKLIFCNNKPSHLIQYDELVAISEYLTKNNTLQELSLSWHSINGSDEVTRLAEAIVVNTGLHTLDLSSQYFNNPVGTIMILLCAMEHNYTLTRLVLPKNVSKDEATLKLKSNQINEVRIKDDIKPLMLDSTAS